MSPAVGLVLVNGAGQLFSKELGDLPSAGRVLFSAQRFFSARLRKPALLLLSGPLLLLERPGLLPGDSSSSLCSREHHGPLLPSSGG